MATSGSYSFNFNKIQIITKALQLINVVAYTGVISSSDASNASDTLNMMIKLWEAEGIKLWKRRQATLFTQVNQHVYSLGSVTGADRATNSYVNTVLSLAVQANTNVLTVTSTNGFAVSMNIGLELDNETRQWGTISSINTMNNTITVSFQTSFTAAAGQTIVAYNSLINRPLKVMRATYVDLKANNTEVTLDKISYDTYFNLPQKNTPGPPTNFYYDKILGGVIPSTGTLYVYPNPNVTSKLISFTYLDSIQDMINNTDNADFPQEWVYPLVFNLAVELAYSYGKFGELQQLQPKADQLKDVIDNFDSDDENVHFELDWSSINRRYNI